MSLYPYQEEGARWLADRPRALLADDMGLGKSAQAIAACDAVGAMDVAVVCPASLQGNWRMEFNKFSDLVPTVHSYDAVARGALADGRTWDVLILDEAHYLKTPAAKRTKAIYGPKCDGVGGLVERAERVILLSGTPMPNHPAELWPALRALAPETITSARSGKVYSYWQFVAAYCKTINKGFGEQIVGARNHEKLAEVVAPFMLRRRKDEVLKDLPPIRFDTLYLEGAVPAGMDGPEAELVRDALERGGVEGLRSLSAHVATLRRLTGMAKVGPAIDWVGTWLDCGDEKIVIFAHHRDVIEQLYQGLYVDPLHSGLPLTGDRTADERDWIVRRFQDDPRIRVFIGQMQAAGTGLTLTAASNVLFVESSWVPSDNSQAAMRIHRIGQRNACMVRFATLAGSIDEQIQRAVARKTADITRVLDADA